jgi:hypothetical protein
VPDHRSAPLDTALCATRGKRRRGVARAPERYLAGPSAVGLSPRARDAVRAGLAGQPQAGAAPLARRGPARACPAPQAPTAGQLDGPSSTTRLPSSVAEGSTPTGPSRCSIAWSPLAAAHRGSFAVITGRSSPPMRSETGVDSHVPAAPISNQARPGRTPTSSRSARGYATSCSQSSCSRAWPRRRSWSPTGARITTSGGRIRRLACKHPRDTLANGKTTTTDSHPRWTNERGPVTGNQHFRLADGL